MAGTRWPFFAHGDRWFRVLGYGVRYADHREDPMLFTERIGKRRVLHIGPHCFAYLRPSGTGGYR